MCEMYTICEHICEKNGDIFLEEDSFFVSLTVIVLPLVTYVLPRSYFD